MKSQINSEKILVKKIFSEMWFQIPEYQRPYVWDNEQITELLEDTSFAMNGKSDSEYFLGTFVFQSHERTDNGIKFTENDLLDGQQRITTILLIFAVLRDMLKDEGENADKEATIICQECIFQKANKYNKTPERSRIAFAIRQEASEFIDEISKNEGVTLESDNFLKYEKESKDISVRNMARAIRLISDFFENQKNQINAEDYLEFILNNVLMIYVSTENLEDAFRLFTILNDRGMPLRNSDILKSKNLGALKSDKEKEIYAKMWEDAESDLGDDFDRFLSYLRTILVKEKARLSLLEEYEDKIYNSKGKEKAAGIKKPALLAKGKETFEFIKKHLKNYQEITSGNHANITKADFGFDNLIKIMLSGFQSTDWLPPLLHYYDKFDRKSIFEFLTLLDNKFSADWIVQLTPTARIEAMNNIIKEIDEQTDYKNVLKSQALAFNIGSVMSGLDGKIYNKRFAKYILLKLDYLHTNHDEKMSNERISIEHILPQNPEANSQWCKDFNEEQRNDMTDILGNLVLIGKRKNSSLGRLDYKEKKDKYFKNKIEPRSSFIKILNNNHKWDVDALQDNHNICLEKLKEHYSA